MKGAQTSSSEGDGPSPRALTDKRGIFFNRFLFNFLKLNSYARHDDNPDYASNTVAIGLVRACTGEDEDDFMGDDPDPGVLLRLSSIIRWTFDYTTPTQTHKHTT